MSRCSSEGVLEKSLTFLRLGTCFLKSKEKDIQEFCMDTGKHAFACVCVRLCVVCFLCVGTR